MFNSYGSYGPGYGARPPFAYGYGGRPLFASGYGYGAGPAHGNVLFPAMFLLLF